MDGFRAKISKLSQENNPIGEYEMGKRYEWGWGITKDPAEALRLFSASADKGFCPALLEIGIMYEDGLGIAKDEAAAAKVFERAMQEGCPESPNSAAWLYARADDPSVRNPRRALMLSLLQNILDRWRDPGDQDTMAQAFFANGEVTQAIKMEEGVALGAPNNKWFQANLQKFRAAAAAAQAASQSKAPGADGTSPPTAGGSNNAIPPASSQGVAGHGSVFDDTWWNCQPDDPKGSSDGRGFDKGGHEYGLDLEDNRMFDCDASCRWSANGNEITWSQLGTRGSGILSGQTLKMTENNGYYDETYHCTQIPALYHQSQVATAPPTRQIVVQYFNTDTRPVFIQWSAGQDQRCEVPIPGSNEVGGSETISGASTDLIAASADVVYQSAPASAHRFQCRPGMVICVKELAQNGDLIGGGKVSCDMAMRDDNNIMANESIRGGLAGIFNTTHYSH